MPGGVHGLGGRRLRLGLAAVKEEHKLVGARVAPRVRRRPDRIDRVRPRRLTRVTSKTECQRIMSPVEAGVLPLPKKIWLLS